MLSWNASANASSYRVYRAESAAAERTLLKVVSNTTTIDNTAVAGNKYYYYIIAYNSRTQEISNYSNALVVTAGISTTAPAVPSFNASSEYANSIVLAWGNAKNATSYRLYRSDSPTGTRKLIKKVANTITADDSVTSGQTYYYFLTAYNSATNEVSSFSAYRKVTAKRSPTAPTTPKFNASSATSNGVILAWDAVKNATSYRIYRSETENGERTLINTVSNTITVDYSAETGRTYYYYVVAFNSNTNEISFYSTYRQIRAGQSSTVPAAPVINSALSTSGSSSVSLKWSAVPNATSYRVYRAESAGGLKTLVKSVSGTDTIDTGLVSGRTYYYYIVAYNSKTAELSHFSASKAIYVS